MEINWKHNDVFRRVLNNGCILVFYYSTAKSESSGQVHCVTLLHILPYCQKHRKSGDGGKAEKYSVRTV